MENSAKTAAVASVLTAVILCSAFASGANAAAKIWEYNDHGQGSCVIEAADGGYVVAGADYGKFLLVKVNAGGGVEWNQTYGEFKEYPCIAYALIQTSDGGFAFTGMGHPNFIKTNAEGGMQWAQTYAKPNAGVFWGQSLLQTADGGYIIAGTNDGGYIEGYKQTNVTASDWIIKTDAQGNPQWNKTYGVSNSISYSDPSIVEAGESAHIVGGNSGVVKIDAEGNVIWLRKNLTGPLIATADGGFLLWRTSSVLGTWPKRTFNAYLAKIDGEGNIEWNRTYAEVGDRQGVTFNGAAEAHGGGYVVCGEADWYDPNPSMFPSGFACAHVTKICECGEIEWSVDYPAIGPPMPSQQNVAYDIKATSDGAYIFVGAKRTYLWLVKLDEQPSLHPKHTPSPSPTPSPTLYATQNPSPNPTATPKPTSNSSPNTSQAPSPSLSPIIANPPTHAPKTQAGNSPTELIYASIAATAGATATVLAVYFKRRNNR